MFTNNIHDLSGLDTSSLCNLGIEDLREIYNHYDDEKVERGFLDSDYSLGNMIIDNLENDRTHIHNYAKIENEEPVEHVRSLGSIEEVYSEGFAYRESMHLDNYIGRSRPFKSDDIIGVAGGAPYGGGCYNNTDAYNFLKGGPPEDLYGHYHEEFIVQRINKKARDSITLTQAFMIINSLFPEMNYTKRINKREILKKALERVRHLKIENRMLNSELTRIKNNNYEFMQGA